MLFPTRFFRACAALAFLGACGGEPMTVVPAAASTPPLIWRDVARLNILCLVQTETGVDRGTLNDLVCGRVRDLASAGSPMPVAILAPGDPELLAPGSVTLLVHASVQPDAAGRLLAFSIRPFRASADPLLFSAAPRAVRLSEGAGGGPELDAALRAALSDTLPWLATPAGPRPISH